ncbi:reverse transcriptase domain-containing protein [Tanacetum coccineum]
MFLQNGGRKILRIYSEEKIRANPENAKAVVNMPSRSNLKQMQRLSGKLAALNRFLSKVAERALPCLDTLKECINKKDFHWTTEAEEAFHEMKKLMAELSTLTAPKKEEELMVYLLATNEAVSAVLLVEREGRQALIHYASRTLQDTMAEDSSTQVKTKRPSDTLAEGESMEEQEAMETKAPKNLRTKTDIWKLYTDGASNEHGSGAGRKNACVCRFKIGSEQVEGSYEAKGEKTKKYKENVLEIIGSFNNFRISHIPREENRKADALSKVAAVQCEGLMKGVLVEELNERSVDMAEVNAIIKEALRT